MYKLNLQPFDIFIIAFLYLLVHFFYWNLESIDIWWHLECAEYILRTFTFPSPDKKSTNTILLKSQVRWVKSRAIYGVTHHFYRTQVSKVETRLFYPW